MTVLDYSGNGSGRWRQTLPPVPEQMGNKGREMKGETSQVFKFAESKDEEMKRVFGKD